MMRHNKHKRQRFAQHAAAAEPVIDYGPAFKRNRGRPIAWAGAALVDIETRDDPAITDRRSTIQGARRRHILHELKARAVIDKRMFDAAQAFLDDCSLAVGSSPCGDLGMTIRKSPGPSAGLPERQLCALNRVRDIIVLLDLHTGTVFWWVVFDNGSLADYEQAHKGMPCGKGAAGEALRASLAALDAHYHRGMSRLTSAQ
jgi:hypothetical protein